ncbi:MAG: lysophospholipase [Dehalococcoidia bacterium]
MTTEPPAILLFVQHGWADTSASLRSLARGVSTPRTKVINPNLGYLRTWIRMDALVDHVEKEAAAEIDANPGALIRVVGHSMGGLIWLELLDRRPEWWTRVDGVVLVGSPIGGAPLANVADPMNLAIGRDLKVDRRAIASRISEKVRVLSIAGDYDGFGDGLVTVVAAQAPGVRLVTLPGTHHMGLRRSRLAMLVAREFFRRTEPVSPPTAELVAALRAIPGMTDGPTRGYFRPPLAVMFLDGTTIRAGRTLMGVDEVYLVGPDDLPRYAGYVGWLDSRALRRGLKELRERHADQILWAAKGLSS